MPSSRRSSHTGIETSFLMSPALAGRFFTTREAMLCVFHCNKSNWGKKKDRASFPQESRQEQWSGFSCPSPGDLPNPGIKLRSPMLQVDSSLSEPPERPRDKPHNQINYNITHMCLIDYE